MAHQRAARSGSRDMVHHRRRRHVQRHLHVHVLQQDAGAVADRRLPAVRRPRPTARSSARASGMVALKRLADAERDGDRIYAVIRGIGSSSDGEGKSVYAPRAEGQARALRRAYAARGLRPRHGRAGRGARHRHEGRRRGRVRGAARRSSASAAARTGSGARSARSSRRSATPRRRPARRG